MEYIQICKRESSLSASPSLTSLTFFYNRKIAIQKYIYIFSAARFQFKLSILVRGGEVPPPPNTRIVIPITTSSVRGTGGGVQDPYSSSSSQTGLPSFLPRMSHSAMSSAPLCAGESVCATHAAARTSESTHSTRVVCSWQDSWRRVGTTRARVEVITQPSQRWDDSGEMTAVL